MRKHLRFILSIGLFSLALGAANRSNSESMAVRGQGNRSGDQNYVGLWGGTWTNENGPTKGTISYALNRDNKGQWCGTVNFKYQNQPEEDKADLQSLQIAGGKMKAKFEIEGGKGAREFTVISHKGSTDIVGKWTWKTTRSAAAEPGR